MAEHIGPVDPDERVQPYLAAGGGRPGGRRRRSTALVVAVMAVFAGGLWLAYLAGGRRGAASGPVPLIRAAPGPLKRKPAEPGGMQVPGRHMLIFGERHPKVEHLLPAPPAPMPLPQPPSPPTSEAQATPAPTSPTASSAEEPSAAPAANPATAPLRARPQVAIVRPPRKPAARPRHPAAKPAAKPAAHAARRNGRRVQLGTLRDPAAARREWDRLKRSNPRLLGRLSAFAVRTDLGKRGVFYRIVTAPFADGAAAGRLCAALKRRHVGCFVVH